MLLEGKISSDEPAILPPLPIIPKVEKRNRAFYGTPQSKRLDFRDREWDRERDRDFELMPPPGSNRKEFVAAMDIEQPIDPNEPTYCVCHQVLPSLLILFSNCITNLEIQKFLYSLVCCIFVIIHSGFIW